MDIDKCLSVCPVDAEVHEWPSREERRGRIAVSRGNRSGKCDVTTLAFIAVAVIMLIGLAVYIWACCNVRR